MLSRMPPLVQCSWGAFTGLAVKFHSIEPLSGFLLLPFVGYSVFGAALLTLSLHSSNAEVRASAACKFHLTAYGPIPSCQFWKNWRLGKPCAAGITELKAWLAKSHAPANCSALLRSIISPHQESSSELHGIPS